MTDPTTPGPPRSHEDANPSPRLDIEALHPGASPTHIESEDHEYERYAALMGLRPRHRH
jgi:hypothetical protein